MRRRWRRSRSENPCNDREKGERQNDSNEFPPCGGGKIDALTEQVETLKQEVDALKTQVGTQFRYIGEYMCSGTGSVETPAETIIQLDGFGIYLLFMTQIGVWNVGNMILVDLTEGQGGVSTLLLSNSGYFASDRNDNITVKATSENKQIIVASKIKSNVFAFVYKVAQRT